MNSLLWATLSCKYCFGKGNCDEMQCSAADNNMLMVKIATTMIRQTVLPVGSTTYATLTQSGEWISVYIIISCLSADILSSSPLSKCSAAQKQRRFFFECIFSPYFTYLLIPFTTPSSLATITTAPPCHLVYFLSLGRRISAHQLVLLPFQFT